MLTSLAAYVAAAALLTVTPGADTLVVLRYAASRGASAGLAAGAGILAGLLVWGGIVALGIAALLVAYPLAYELLRWAGAAYLVWLGLQLLLRRRQSGQEPAPRPRSPAAGPFLVGLMTNLLNPKVGIFYLAFLPQFVPAGVAEAPFILLLAAIHALLGLLWFLVLVGAAGRAARGFRDSRLARLLQTATGLLFVAFGARLLFGAARG